MPLFIQSKKYEISVRILGGEGDGTIVYLDHKGVINVVGGGDPRVDREKVQAAAKQIEAGAASFEAAMKAGARA